MGRRTRTSRAILDQRASERMIQRLSHTHEAIMLWLVLNPTRTQRECAKELGYTEGWLSQVINSDMFQAEYKQRCREANVIATHTMQAKLGAVTAKIIDRIDAQLDKEPSERFLVDTANMALERLGYTGKPDGGATTPAAPMQIYVKGDLLVQAREEARAQGVLALDGDVANN